MKKTIAVFLRHGPRWNPELPVRKQAYWDEHARFMDALRETRLREARRVIEKHAYLLQPTDERKMQ